MWPWILLAITIAAAVPQRIGAQSPPKQAVIETSLGTFVIDLAADAAPNQCAYFMKQAASGAYDAVYIYADAVAKAGSAKPDDVIKALEKTDYMGVCGRVQFDGLHEVKDGPGFVNELKQHRFTMITGVNTLFNALLNHPAFAKLDFSALKVTLGGGMAVQRAVAERWKQVTGKPLLEAYGLTEASPAVTINPLDLSEYNGSIGLPIPSTEMKCVDDAFNEVAAGEPGAAGRCIWHDHRCPDGNVDGNELCRKCRGSCGGRAHGPG